MNPCGIIGGCKTQYGVCEPARCLLLQGQRGRLSIQPVPGRQGQMEEGEAEGEGPCGRGLPPPPTTTTTTNNLLASVKEQVGGAAVPPVLSSCAFCPSFSGL